MVGKTFRSKINGKVFRVLELRTEGNQQTYKICELATGKIVMANKRVFEEMCLTNLELIEGETV